ncbi:MAG: RelA/SpoT family protein, partial [Notoacmeibacter sp.]
KHGMQRRASGDPYISHPIEVAGILAGMRLDEATIAVALLHDTIEDTDATREDIEKNFGEEIGSLVDALTKLKKLDLVTKSAQQAENLRRFLLATAKDIRVLLVKLADRLHNMRTLDHVPPDKRKRISEETMELYAPLAGRMGMQDMREELEDLCFQHINPAAYATVSARLKDVSDKNRDLLRTIEIALTELLLQNGVQASVKSRQKRPWSVFRKMETKGISFDSLPDVFGLRLLVDSVQDCYRALGVIHQQWNFIPGRFKDYISTPKQNDYQSLHTTVFGPSLQRIELQIRTKHMHTVAEFGIAAHALYKEKQRRAAAATDASAVKVEDSRAFAWLRQTIDALAEGDNAEEFLENTKLELFQDQVFCFTPKGKLI